MRRQAHTKNAISAVAGTDNIISNSLSFCLFHFPYDLPYRKNKSRCHRQFVHAHFYKFFCQRSIRSQFPANTCPDTFLMCIVHNHLDHPQDRLVMGIINRIQLCILPVYCQRILCQIVGSYTEKVHFFCQQVAPLNSSQLQAFGIRHQRDAEGNRTLREWPTGITSCPSLIQLQIGSNDIRKVTEKLTSKLWILDIADNPNISIDVTSVCPNIEAGMYALIYDKTQDIRGCDALGIER